MKVQALWRYPVKSLQGEPLHEVGVTASGLDGDRRYAIFDADTGIGLTGRRAPQLLFASARLTSEGAAEITLPDGSIADGDDALSTWLGRPVVVRSAADDVDRNYEDLVDFEREPSSNWKVFGGARGPFHDSDRARVSLVSAATVGAWDPRRFRPNVLLSGEGEDALIGTTVRVDDAVFDIVGRIRRCVMVTRPQPGGIDRDLSVLRTIARQRASLLAVGALVTHPGILRVGDELYRS